MLIAEITSTEACMNRKTIVDHTDPTGTAEEALHKTTESARSPAVTLPPYLHSPKPVKGDGENLPLTIELGGMQMQMAHVELKVARVP